MSIKSLHLPEIAPFYGRKTDFFRIEIKIYFASRAVAVLFHVYFGDIFSVRIRLVFVFSVNKHHHIGILFNGTGISQVVKLGDGRVS